MYFRLEINAPEIKDLVMLHPVHYENGTKGEFVIMIDLVNSRCLLYADDLKLFRVIQGNKDRELLQHDLNKLAEWSSKNKLPLNIKKCYKMTFTRSLQPIDTAYSIGEETLESHEKMRDLGVVVQRDLKFGEQLQSISMKAKRNLGAIMRYSKHFSNSGTIRALYFTLVRSHLDFGSVVWSSLEREGSNNLEKIQKRALKYLYFKDFGYYEHEITYRELVSGYELSTMKERRDSTLLLFLRDLLNSKIESPPLLQIIMLNAPPRTHRRRNSTFYVPLCRTAQFQTAPLHQAQALYNKIEEIDTTIDIFFDSRATFQNKIRNALRELHCEPV
mgnify:CR=1 FL=1